MEKMHRGGMSKSFDSSMLNREDMTPEVSDEWMSSLSSWKTKRIQYTSTERGRKAERDEVEQSEHHRQRRKSKTYREIVEEKEKREKALQKIYKKKASVDDDDIDYIMWTDSQLITMSEDDDSSQEENFEPQTRYRSNTLPKSFGSQFKEPPPTAPKPATRLARRIQAHKKAPEESFAPPVRDRPSVFGLFDEPDGRKPEQEIINEPIVQAQHNSMEKSKPHDFRGNFHSKLVSAREREHTENSKNSTVWQPEKRRVSLGIKSRMAAYNQSLDLDSQVPKKPEPKKDDETQNRPFIEKTISMTQRPCNEKGFGFTFSGGSEVKKPPTIEKIKKGSTAGSCDIQPGDVIVSVNGDKVLSASYEEIEYSISHAVLIGRMSIKVRRYDSGDSGSLPLDDNPFKSMLSDDPISPPSMGLKRTPDRKNSHELPVRDVPMTKPTKAPVELPQNRNQYGRQVYSASMNTNQSNHQEDESMMDGRVIEEPMIQAEKKEAKTFASPELFKPIVEDACQQHVIPKDEGAPGLDELFDKDADDERSMSDTEAEQYEAEIMEEMQREAEAERKREERHRSIEQDELPVEAPVSCTVKKPEPSLNFERFQEHNKPVRSSSPSYSVPKPFKTPKYQPVPLRTKKVPEQGREKLTKRRSDFFNEEDGKNVEDLWKQVERQGEKEKAPVPVPAPKPSRRSFNVDEERKRLERWQQEQERLRQERYAKDQEKLRNENQKALEKAAEDDRRKKQEEKEKLNEMTQKLISPREEIDKSVADQFMEKLLQEEQIRDQDMVKQGYLPDNQSTSNTAESDRLARQQEEEAWEREMERERLLKEKEQEKRAREREMKLKLERERQEQERVAQAQRDEAIRKEHEAMERKLKEEKDKLDRKWQELQREKERQEERERQERERLEQLRSEQERLRQERYRLEQQQLEEKRLLDLEKERIIRQAHAETLQHQLPNKSQYRQLAGIAQEPKPIERENPFKVSTDSLEDTFLPKDIQAKNNVQGLARDRNDNKVIPEKDRPQQVSYMSKYKDPSLPQNTHWLVQEAERRRVADQKKRDMESPTNQIKGDLDNEPVLEKERAFNVESAKTVFTESAPNPKYIEDEQPVRMRSKRGNTNEWQAKKEKRRSMPTFDTQPEEDPRQTQDDADVIRRSFGANDTFAPPPSSTNGPLPDAVMQTFPQKTNGPKPANTQLPNLGKGSAFQPLGQKKQPRSVSGKVSCTNCTKPLGRGAAMIIESLGLHYHIDCFRCCVCSIRLGNGSKGTDVRIRASKLHCQSCYSNDAGFEFTEV